MFEQDIAVIKLQTLQRKSNIEGEIYKYGKDSI